MLDKICYAIKHEQLIRRLVLLLGIVFLGVVTWWSMWFASHAPAKYDAAGVGVIIAAVQAPSTLLIGHLVSLYNSARKDNA
jgi:hypothetical protein